MYRMTGQILLGFSIVALSVTTSNFYSKNDTNEVSMLLKKMDHISQKLENNSSFFSEKLQGIKIEFQDRASFLENSITQLRATNPTLAKDDLDQDIIQAKQQLLEIEDKLESVALEIKGNNLQSENNDFQSSTETADLSQDELIEKETNESERQIAYFDETISTEDRDPDWSASTEELIKNGLEIENSKLSYNDVQCVTSMCRVELSSTGEDSSDVFHSIETQLNWDGQMYLNINHETNETLAYLARDGVELQRVEP